MTIPPGHRFEATQALRQVLARAVVWGLLDGNPAKQGVDNPQRRRTEKCPFESWAELDTVAATARAALRLDGALCCGDRNAPRRVDRARAARHRHRSAGRLRPPRLHEKVRLECTKTEASVRAVPLQAIALATLDQLPTRSSTPLLFPAAHGGYLDLHNFRTRDWKPAQLEAGITPLAPRLRSPAHLRNLRAACRHLNLRPLPLHGRQPDHDRPPLRPPRPRRTRTRHPAPRHPQHQHHLRRWTLVDAPVDTKTTSADPPDNWKHRLSRDIRKAL